MLITLIELAKSALGFFTKTKTIEKEVQTTSSNGQIETNKIEIEKNTLHWRNVLGFVLALIVTYSYIIIPLADFFGIVMIQMPLEPIFRLLFVLLGSPM